MKARWPVGYRAYASESQDAMGNAVAAYEDVVVWLAFAVEDLDGVEPVPGRRDAILRKRLYFPAGRRVDPRDVFVVDGDDFEVVGGDDDWTRGPFEFEPGVVVTVRRAEG